MSNAGVMERLNSPPTQPTGPQLTPQFCFDTRVLRDFLRLSRAQLDDTISTNLNSLLAPSQTSPFDPTSTKSPMTSNRKTRPPIPPRVTDEFLTSTLFPSWQNRSKVLTYCSLIASSPDPNDPNLEAITAENAAAAQRKIDERLDPYSGRFFAREPRTEQLATLLRNENAVEAIIRERTWRVLSERCDPGVGSRWGQRWDHAVDRWILYHDDNHKP